MGKLREARLGPGEACLAAPNVSTCLLTGDKQRCVDFSLYDVNSSDWTVKNPKVLNGQIVVSGVKISAWLSCDWLRQSTVASPTFFKSRLVEPRRIELLTS